MLAICLIIVLAALYAFYVGLRAIGDITEKTQTTNLYLMKKMNMDQTYSIPKWIIPIIINKKRLYKTKNEEFLPMISLDDADAIIRSIDGGLPIESKDLETIKWLVENQPKRKEGELYKEEDIINLILKGLGVRKELPKGGRSWADYIINKPNVSTYLASRYVI